ncbi:type III secretion system inner rod subunit SctI [Pseudomonas sp. PCH199]|uniref:type III secretion system inner rod subunit SctI n=1 Tax=unclassified Pseudomonas TaxID=196821 RepID=UPI000BD562E9|nr:MULTISPECIES: type III secretion system inner rod subunit SctI [unclassified Pseudomonas]MCW8277100.1 type III secretion system inner rod subunit SctI [Pseudomonas sp. PCH199]PAM82597.1 type III secretion system protein PrgJ [Pseudomonas sp. ERMR1:02]
MSIQNIAGSLIQRTAFTQLRGPQEGPIVSLESRLIEAFGGSAVSSERDVSAINQLMQSPDITSPEVLAQLQELTGQYNVDINLLNTLVRKAVGTAETLLRSS